MSDLRTKYSATIMSGGALVFFLILTQVGVVYWSPSLAGGKLYEYSILSLFAIIGATAGWFLGIVVSPRSDKDKRFALVSSAIATFFSGFLVSKLNAVVDWLSKPAVDKDSPDRYTVLIRLAFSVGWFMIALTITFLTRTDDSPPSQ